jgi:nucleoside-diphosphate-sugar epimerase
VTDPAGAALRPVAALTGGTGFLGRSIAQGLTEAGWQVRLLVRSAPLHPQLETLPLDLVLGDLADRAALARLVSGAEIVIHGAGLVKARSAEAFMTVNRDGARRLAEAVAVEPSAPCLLLISSLAARAPGLSGYAASKRAGEQAVAEVLGHRPWTILRPSAIYGPWDREGLAMLQLAAGRFAPAISLPEPRIAMIHVRDAAAAVCALARAEFHQQTWEVSDARTDGYGWRELLARIGSALGRAPRPIPLPDAALLLAGCLSDGLAALRGEAAIFGAGKAREILHRDWSIDPAQQIPPTIWQPGIDLDTGLRETVAWWRGLSRPAA